MIWVSSLVMVRPRPVPGTDTGARHAAALERLEDALQIGVLGMPMPVSAISNSATWLR